MKIRERFIDRFKRYYDSDVVEVIIVWKHSLWEGTEIAYLPLWSSWYRAINSKYKRFQYIKENNMIQ